jgi:hypothetical protein
MPERTHGYRPSRALTTRPRASLDVPGRVTLTRRQRHCEAETSDESVAAGSATGPTSNWQRRFCCAENRQDGPDCNSGYPIVPEAAGRARRINQRSADRIALPAKSRFHNRLGDG